MGLAGIWMWNCVPWRLRADTLFVDLTSLVRHCQISFLQIVHSMMLQSCILSQIEE